MNIKKTVLLGVASVMGVASANAAFYRDVDLGPAGLLSSAGPTTSYSGVFDIHTGDNDTITIGHSLDYVDNGITYKDIAGFTAPPGVETVHAYFYVRDDAVPASSEATMISIDLVDWVPSTVVNSGASIFSGNIGGFGTIVADLNADGNISYTVTATQGDFFLDYARLDVTTAPDGGSTAILLGAGLLGMGAVARRKSLGLA